MDILLSPLHVGEFDADVVGYRILAPSWPYEVIPAVALATGRTPEHARTIADQLALRWNCHRAMLGAHIAVREFCRAVMGGVSGVQVTACGVSTRVGHDALDISEIHNLATAAIAMTATD